MYNNCPIEMIFMLKRNFYQFYLNYYVFHEKILTIQFCFDFLQFAFRIIPLKKNSDKKEKKNRQIVAILNLPKDEIKAGGYSDQAIPIIIEQEPGQSDNER